MRKMMFGPFSCLAAAVLSLGCSIESAPIDDLEGRSEQAVGNGSPSGAHYNLNIIGVARNKNPNMNGNSGGRIFVDLSGRTKIMLIEGSTFDVLDANGTDGVAQFQLPRPSSTNPTYRVYARALGKPGGVAFMQTCATDPSTGEELCNEDVDGDPILVELKRSKGKSTFSDVSNELLQVCGVVATTGQYKCYDLFDSALEDYFWDYDNQGLRLAQLRFYPL